MSYSIDYRKRVIEYRQEGHTREKTHQVFRVSLIAIREWEKKWRETRDLTPKVANRPYKKINPEKLKAYIAEHPDAYLQEIADEFGCVESAVHKALKRLNIMRKKDKALQRNKIRIKYKNMRKKYQIYHRKQSLMWMKPV